MNLDLVRSLIQNAIYSSGHVPLVRTITINGTEYDLSDDRTWTIPKGFSDVISNNGTGPGTMASGQTLIYINEDDGHTYWVFCDGVNRYAISEDLSIAQTWTGLE